jgi:hypothetical protein
MKVLVATKETQGQRKNDFCWCEPDELLIFGFECDGEEIDGNCGCRRSMCGVNTRAATTTMKVIDKDISKEDFVAGIRKSLKDGGWSIEIQDLAGEKADELLSLAAQCSAGDILEKRGDIFRKRK